MSSRNDFQKYPARWQAFSSVKIRKLLDVSRMNGSIGSGTSYQWAASKTTSAVPEVASAPIQPVSLVPLREYSRRNDVTTRFASSWACIILARTLGIASTSEMEAA